jgi:hypothetical protein
MMMQYGVIVVQWLAISQHYRPKSASCHQFYSPNFVEVTAVVYGQLLIYYTCAGLAYKNVEQVTRPYK